jgi:hypothetical protein
VVHQELVVLVDMKVTSRYGDLRETQIPAKILVQLTFL